MLLKAVIYCMPGKRKSWTDRLPQPGRCVEVLALGRSRHSICGCLEQTRTKLLVDAGGSIVRPVEGELFRLLVHRRSRENGSWLLEGSILSARLEPSALRFEPLALFPRDEDRPSGPDGVERAYELERILPSAPGFPDDGALALREVSAFWSSGDLELAELLAGEMLARDLRCLEVHALLGEFFSDAPLETRWTERALRHFRVGVALGEQALGREFEGRLPWRWRGNRGLLRCLYGYGRCQEYLGQVRRAVQLYERLLALAPEDPLGVRESLGKAKQLQGFDRGSLMKRPPEEGSDVECDGP